MNIHKGREPGNEATIFVCTISTCTYIYMCTAIFLPLRAEQCSHILFFTTLLHIERILRVVSKYGNVHMDLSLNLWEVYSQSAEHVFFVALK